MFDSFTVGGHGGSGKDTSNTGARCRHLPSGASGEGREHRSWIKNREAAFRKMAESSAFKAWHKLETARRMGRPSVDSLVDAAMEDRNLRVEVKDDAGKWTECR